MTAVSADLRAPQTAADRPELVTTSLRRPPTRRQRLARLVAPLVARRRSAIVLLVLLVIGGLLHGTNMYGAPQTSDDEGTYVAQAWAVLNLGELAHYTYWYDHPPLGWLQLAGYAALTSAFERAPYAVAAGREFLLVVQLVSMALLWVLARRVGLPRWSAALTVLLFSVSPLAVQFHRVVYLDNIATPWLLGAFVLALSPARRLSAFAGAALAFGVAVLTKETSLLLLPALAWVLWRSSAGETRRYLLAVASSLLVLIGSGYLLFALLKGELLPGAARTDLLTGVSFQLGGRDASGSVFTDGTAANRTASVWLGLDMVLPALSVLASVAGLLVRALRPYAVGLLIMLAMLVRPDGYVPVPFVIAMLPFGALLVGGVAAQVWRRVAGSGRPVGRASALLAVPVVLVASVVAGSAAMRWTEPLQRLLEGPADQSLRDAQAWVDANVPLGQRILTDDALWVDLVEAGRPRDQVVWFYKPDTDRAVPSGWQNYAWVISTGVVRDDPSRYPTLAGALDRATPAAVFGSGPERVEVLRVQSAPPDQAAQEAAERARGQAGQALAGNPNLSFSSAAAAQLDAGRVDGRLLAALATLAVDDQLRISDFPAVAGEADAVRRTVLVDQVNGRALPDAGASVTAIREQLQQQTGAFRPRAVAVERVGGADVLAVTFPLPAP